MEKTYVNLAQAYVGECQARMRYTFFASIAKKEGYERVAEVFRVTADQEKEHASNLYKFIVKLAKKKANDGEIMLDQVPVVNVRGTTMENLQSAIEGENHEEHSMYPDFAKVAQAEGYPEIAAKMRAIAKAEGNHAKRYGMLLKLIKDEKMFSRDKEVNWICRECGYAHKGKSAPVKCPSCDHPQSFYELECTQY